MGGTIHFTSGKTLDITEREFNNIAPKLKNGGIRLVMTSKGDFIPLNSNTMEYIEHTKEEPNGIPEQPVRQDGEEINAGRPNDEEKPAQIEETPKEEVQEKSIQERKEDALAELMEKSNCKHEPEKMVLHVQHTAKGVRYFPVCGFCGKRERYVSEKKIIDGDYKGTPNEKWTKEDIDTATAWTEK
jgi:hypothetical protein